MDAQLFVRYFESSHVNKNDDKNAGPISKLLSPPPVISVPGFVYPVEEFYLEDILEKSGFAPRGAKGWRNAETGDVDSAVPKKGGDEDVGNGEDGPDPQDDGSKSVRPYALDSHSREKYSRFTLESLQKLFH